MNPRDYLDVAGEWVGGTREAEWRSAVSRAYYAAFHVAARLLSQCGFGVPGAEAAHGYVWLRLSNAGHPDVNHTGSELKLLRRVRNWADYNLDKPMSERQATYYFQSAIDIVQMLDAAAATPAVCRSITDTIKIYERDVLDEVTWRP